MAAIRLAEHVREDSTPFKPFKANFELRPLSNTQWRVIDVLKAENREIDLVAFIECTGDEFEVICIGRPSQRRFVASLEAALAFVREVESTPARRLKRVS